MHIIERATVQSYHRWRRGTSDSHALGYRSDESQTRRFEALCRWGNMTGLSVLDVGCGYGDLKTFIEHQYTLRGYLGIDFLPEFIDEAKKRFDLQVGTEFICCDFFNTALPRVDLVFASGSLNYYSENKDHPWTIIEKMWRAARVGMAFNLLDKHYFDGDSFLCAYSHEAVLDFCRRLENAEVELVQGYLPDDFTILLTRRN